MKIALGFKAHSGWAAMVAVAKTRNGFEVIERRRIELTPMGEYEFKQPYHAAEELEPAAARETVRCGTESARALAVNAISEIVFRLSIQGNEIASCAVLMPVPMPDWSVEEILAVHPRMHKAEGVLFPEALCLAAQSNNLPLVEVREKQLFETAEQILNTSAGDLAASIASIGKQIGPPWTKDQKTAAIAAMIAHSGEGGADSGT